jgi:hypothetical protein
MEAKLAAVEAQLAELRSQAVWARDSAPITPTTSSSSGISMDQAIRDISDRARSMQMERDGWKAESERLGRMLQEERDARPAERDYWMGECKRLEAENAEIRSEAKAADLEHTTLLEEWMANMESSANTISKLRSDLDSLGGAVNVKNEIDTSLQSDLEACKEDLLRHREAYESVRSELATITTAHQRLRGEKMMADLELQEGRKELKKLDGVITKMRTELEELRNQQTTAESSDKEELVTAKKTISVLTAELAGSQTRVKSLQDKLVAEEKVAEIAQVQARSWEKDCSQIKASLRDEIAARKQVQVQLEQCANGLQSALQQHEALRAERDRVVQELANVKRQLSERDAAIRELRQSKALASTSASEAAQRQIASIEAKCKRMLAEAKEAFDKQILTMQEKSATQSENERLEARRMAAQIKTLETTLNQQNQQIKQLQDERRAIIQAPNKEKSSSKDLSSPQASEQVAPFPSLVNTARDLSSTLVNSYEFYRLAANAPPVPDRAGPSNIPGVSTWSATSDILPTRRPSVIHGSDRVTTGSTPALNLPPQPSLPIETTMGTFPAQRASNNPGTVRAKSLLLPGPIVAPKSALPTRTAKGVSNVHGTVRSVSWSACLPDRKLKLSVIRIRTKDDFHLHSCCSSPNSWRVRMRSARWPPSTPLIGKCKTSQTRSFTKPSFSIKTIPEVSSQGCSIGRH